ncbi:MAG: 16S rRNA (cytidine(1402)-2'-O)-methyltransferase [Parvularculales bacterium]
MTSETGATLPFAAGKTLTAGLYVAATPIGNAGDITLRALEALKRADVILCEDTRITGRLLTRYGVTTPLKSYHDHNAQRVRPGIIAQLQEGAVIVLVSDAGTPLISDPGFRLVKEAQKASIKVMVLPGASAVLAGLAIAGLPTDRFFFGGFLPPRSAARRKALTQYKDIPATLVFFESPRRLAAALGDMAHVLGHREAAIGRELTKKFEEVRRNTLDVLAADYKQTPPKGEVTVMIAPPDEREIIDDDTLDAHLAEAMQEHGLANAASQVAAETGMSRRVLYRRALALREEQQ